jgi:hypothetical protein
MTPKEKADWLVKKYAIWFWNHDICQEVLHYEIAKQCALIAVDEMLGNAGMIWGGRNTETGLTARDEFRKYWHQVKQELEKV